MPRSTDPTQLLVLGTGRAPQGSVPVSALATVNFTTVTGSALLASQVSVVTPLPLSGDNLQEHVDGVSALAPRPLPLLLDEQFAAGGWSFSPPLVSGLYGDPPVAAAVVNAGVLEVEFVLFPADRGVLAVEFFPGGGPLPTPVAAVDLGLLFVDGNLDSSAAPARIIGQLNYAANSNPAASIGVLPQGANLTDRLPRLADYAASNFPFLVPPPAQDPVYPAYAEDFPGQQIARLRLEIPLAVGDNGEGRVVLYRSRQDYEAAQLGQPFQHWGLQALDPLPIFRDDSLVPVAITAANLNNPSPSTTLDPQPRRLSGVTLYSPVDTFGLTWSGTGLYDNSFLAEGARAQVTNLDPATQGVGLSYLTYSPAGTAPGDASSFSDLAFSYEGADVGVRAGRPALLLTDPQGNEDRTLITGPGFFLFHGLTGPLVANPLREDFSSELSRYDIDPADPFSALATYLPDGSGSTWDPAAALGLGALQVRAVPEGRAYLEYGGGELAYPDTDYSSLHFPSTRDGVSAQRNYAGSTGTRAWVRAFDMGSPRQEGVLLIAGTPPLGYATLLEALQDPVGAGLEIDLAPTGQATAFWGSLLRPYNGGGLALSYQALDAFRVRVSFRLPLSPILASGFYPVSVRVVMINAGLAATSGAFGLQLIQLNP